MRDCADGTCGTNRGFAGVMAGILAGFAVLLLVWQFVKSNAPVETPAMFEGAPVTLRDASQRAGEGGLIFAYATADWCPPCQHYKKTALSDERVAAWVRANATPAYIDIDRNTGDAQTLGASAIPMTVIMNAKGEVLASATGAMPADRLLEMLEGAKRKNETAPPAPPASPASPR